MDPVTFIFSLPSVDLSALEPSDRDCSICREPFEEQRYHLRSRTVPTNNSGTGERAVRLPCGHLFGSECIVGWLIDNNNCPICRVTVLEHLDEHSRIPAIHDTELNCPFALALLQFMTYAHNFPNTSLENFDGDSELLGRVRERTTNTLDTFWRNTVLREDVQDMFDHIRWATYRYADSNELSVPGLRTFWPLIISREHLASTEMFINLELKIVLHDYFEGIDLDDKWRRYMAGENIPLRVVRRS